MKYLNKSAMKGTKATAMSTSYWNNKKKIETLKLKNLLTHKKILKNFLPF